MFSTLFHTEQPEINDADLVYLVNEARTDADFAAAVRMGNMRARARQINTVAKRNPSASRFARFANGFGTLAEGR